MITKRATETKLITVNFDDSLESTDQLTGTPTAVEVETADLTIGTVAIDSGIVTWSSSWAWSWLWPWRWSGSNVLPNRKISFLVSGGTAGQEYRVRVTAATDSGQSLVRDVKLRVN